MSTSQNVSIDDHIKRIHPFGMIEPDRHPFASWTVIGCIKYLLWFPIEFSLTLIICIAGIILQLVGWIKLKRNTKVSPQPLISKSSELNGKNDDLISIIISCYNEAKNIELCLLYLEKYCVNKKKCEIILVDGGSTDGWIEKLQNGILREKHKIITIATKILPFCEHECSGRGICQNLGAKHSNGGILLFVHADTVLFEGFDEYIRKKLNEKDNKILIGSFKFSVNRSLMNDPLIGIGCMELFARIRNILYWLPYGDQTYFVKRDIFVKTLKGFGNDLIVLEDLVFTSNARKYALKTGNSVYIDQDKKAWCSPRRWQKKGVSKNTMINQIIVFCYSYLDYSPADCYKLYYGVDVPKNNNKNVTFDE